VRQLELRLHTFGPGDINDANSVDCPTNGTWTASNEANRFSYNSATDTHQDTPTTRNGIGKLGFLVKAKDGLEIENLRIILLKLRLSSDIDYSC
jgi:hypothetical protein